MKQKDYYTFKELLLGLRWEYQNIQRNLNELKNSIIIDVNGINDYYFQISGDKIVLIIEEGKKRNQINFYRNMYNKFFFDQEYDKKIKVTNNNKFSKNLELVLRSKFYNELEHFIIYNKDKELLKIWINKQAMVLIVGFCDEKYIYYEPRKDTIKIGGSNNPIYRDDLRSMLQQNIPMQLFNYYHKSILSNNLFNKDIIISNEIINKCCMTLSEDNKSLVLEKQRKI